MRSPLKTHHDPNESKLHHENLSTDVRPNRIEIVTQREPASEAPTPMIVVHACTLEATTASAEKAPEQIFRRKTYIG